MSPLQRRKLLIAIEASALSMLLFMAACVHAPSSITTPQGQAAYTADQVVQRVNELENAAIQAEASKALPTNITRIIVQFCVSADMTLKTTPAGWQQTVSVAWKQAKAQIPASVLANPAWSATISGVDVVLAALGGTN